MRFPILTSVADYNLARGDTSDGRTDGRAGGLSDKRAGGDHAFSARPWRLNV